MKIYCVSKTKKEKKRKEKVSIPQPPRVMDVLEHSIIVGVLFVWTEIIEGNDPLVAEAKVALINGNIQGQISKGCSRPSFVKVMH